MLFEGLEEPKQTFAAHDSMKNVFEIRDLMQHIRDGFAEYHDLIKDYQAQNIEALYQKSAADKWEYKFLVVDRNRAWMGKLCKLIHSQPTFVAVGAAHLAGPEGLIQLLIEKGYEVQPVHDTSINKYWTYTIFSEKVKGSF
jgi:uncharacterized protein YbaP (TraB family)